MSVEREGTMGAEKNWAKTTVYEVSDIKSERWYAYILENMTYRVLMRFFVAISISIYFICTL